MRFYTTDQLEPNRHLTPEGILVCKDVAIGRTGEQLYAAREELVHDPIASRTNPIARKSAPGDSAALTRFMLSARQSAILAESSPRCSQVEGLHAAWRDMHLWGQVCDTIKWGNLYGGAVGVLLVDGQRFDTPLRPETVGQGAFRGIYPLDGAAGAIHAVPRVWPGLRHEARYRDAAIIHDVACVGKNDGLVKGFSGSYCIPNRSRSHCMKSSFRSSASIRYGLKIRTSHTEPERSFWNPALVAKDLPPQ